MNDLFGEPIREVMERKRPKRPRKTGYAAPPGTGPKGETCKTCAFYCRVRTGSDRYYLKCGMIRAHWTCGPGTDIKASAPACQHWRKST